MWISFLKCVRVCMCKCVVMEIIADNEVRYGWKSSVWHKLQVFDIFIYYLCIPRPRHMCVLGFSFWFFLIKHILKDFQLFHPPQNNLMLHCYTSKIYSWHNLRLLHIRTLTQLKLMTDENDWCYFQSGTFSFSPAFVCFFLNCFPTSTYCALLLRTGNLNKYLCNIIDDFFFYSR